MESIFSINNLIYLILTISIIINIYLWMKKQTKIVRLNPNDYKDIISTLELLYFIIDFQVSSEIYNQKNILGRDNINSEIFKELYVKITKDVYDTLSKEYKILLLKIFSDHGLNVFIIKKIEQHLIDYMRKNSLI